MAGEKILVIDDEEIIYAVFQKELEKEGYTIDYALDGETGIKLAKNKKYDLIYIDYNMPGGMNGVQTCKEVKKVSPESVAIFMTGTLITGLIVREMAFQNAGGKIYWLYKPFNQDELIEVTRKALAERQ